MTELPMEETKQKIIQHLQRVKKAINRDIAKATSLERRTVDKAVTELVNEGKIIYVNYGGITFLALAGETNEQPPSA